MNKEDSINSANFGIVNNTMIITLTKDLDHHSAKYISDKSDTIMRERNIKNIVINFEAISFMDSSGIGVIMGRYKKILYQGGCMVAINVSPSIDRILRISGLYKIIKKADGLKAAMDIFT